MAHCRRAGGVLVRGAASASAAPCEPLVAAAISLGTTGAFGSSTSSTKLSGGSANRDSERRGIADVRKFLITETIRHFFLSRPARQDDIFLFSPPTRKHAFGWKRFYSTRVPTACPASFADRLASKGRSLADPRSLPAAAGSMALCGRQQSSNSFMDYGSTRGMGPPIIPGVAFPCIVGLNQGLQQHVTSSSRRGSCGQQQQTRGYAFPSLRFFANSGGSSSEAGTESLEQSGTRGSLNSRVSSQQLQMLQQQAEAHLDDEQVQQRYLAALNAQGESYRAVEHVEKHGDKLRGMSEGALIEYVKALCSSGLIHQQGRSVLQVVQRYLAGGGSRLDGGNSTFNAEAPRDASANSSMRSLLQQHQTTQQQLLQQQLMVQLQQLVHQLQIDGVQRRAAPMMNSSADDASSAAAEGTIVKLANTATPAGRLPMSAASPPLTGWRRYSPLRAIKWFCRAFWGLLKACNRGLWGLLLSPVVAVFLFWSFLNDGVQAMQNSVKSMEGNGGLGNQTGGKKASDWVAGKIVKPEEVNTFFADVKGCEEVKKEVVEVVEYLKAPAKFTAMGAHLPKGVLLQGPPGTGKTLLARAIAGEAGVPFIHASGSDFEEMYVGVGASRLRQLFAEARKRSPCILFIDEIDALGGRRTLTENKHHRQTLNQLLTELDGFKPSDGVTLICATNLAEALDPALTRPGRIDRIIHVPLPCKKERIDILQHYAVKMPLAEDVDLDLLASLTSGMTGADLANLLNFAAIRAATEGKGQVTLAEVEESFDRLMVGNRRSSVVMKEEERKVTAYHESGHALMCLYTPGSLPLHKATILFRGSALGVTWSVNREESFSKSLKEYLASLDVAMGGKAAEEIVFGKGNVTSGCFNDLQKATRVARDMVTGFGMGVEDSKAPMVISGKEYAFLSDESKKRVDEAVQRLLDQSYDRARNLLTERREELERLAQALLEHETLTAEEIRAAVAGTIDSAAITERRRHKGSAAQGTKHKVKGGDEGEGEEEQQPPSALLRTGESSFESTSTNTRESKADNQVENQASDSVSSEGVVDVEFTRAPPPSSATLIGSSSSTCSATSDSHSDDNICTSHGNNKGDFTGEMGGVRTAGEAGVTSSDPLDPYTVTGPPAATVGRGAVSALLAAAVAQDPGPEVEIQKQQQPQAGTKLSSEETLSRDRHRRDDVAGEKRQRTEIITKEPAAPQSPSPPTVSAAEVHVMSTRVDPPEAETTTQQLNGGKAKDDKEKHTKEKNAGSLATQEKTKITDDEGGKKTAGAHESQTIEMSPAAENEAALLAPPVDFTAAVAAAEDDSNRGFAM